MSDTTRHLLASPSHLAQYTPSTRAKSADVTTTTASQNGIRRERGARMRTDNQRITMGITVKWTAQCDGCDVVKEKQVAVEEADTMCSLITVMNEGTFSEWIYGDDLIFHSRECCYKWLVLQGRSREAEEVKNEM
jgi:hypothetical protein